MLDPARANDDKSYRVYRQMTAGAYTATFETGPAHPHRRHDGRRYRRAALQAAISPADGDHRGRARRPARRRRRSRLRDLLEKVAGHLRGHLARQRRSARPVDGDAGRAVPARARSGSAIWKTASSPNSRSKASMRAAPQGPVKVGRFALKSLDVANLMRMSAQFAASRRRTRHRINSSRCCCCSKAPRSANLVAPYKDTGKPVNIDTLNLVVGPVRRADPDAGARDGEDDRPGGRERSRSRSSCSPRAGMTSAIDQFRSRRRVDRGHARVRARAGDARNRQRAHGGGAHVGRQRAARDVFAEPAAGRDHGGADRGRADRDRAARHRRRRSGGRAICAHAEHHRARPRAAR